MHHSFYIFVALLIYSVTTLAQYIGDHGAVGQGIDDPGTGGWRES